MKILIYGSDEMGTFNTLNIHQLLDTFPGHEYRFVLLKRKKPFLRELMLELRSRVSQIKHGKNHWLADQRAIEKALIGRLDKKPWLNHRFDMVEKVNDLRSQQLIADFAPDIIVQAGAGILKKEVFGLARLATLNVHHGFAPEIRGMSSNFWALYHGLTDYLGVTCHVIDATLDTGEILAQYRHPYNPGENFIEMQCRVGREGAKLLTDAVALLETVTDPVFEEFEVTSYYFSTPDPNAYKRLKDNAFLPVLSPESATKKKTKIKRIVKR
jgi:methionyl-tRNA formyltransferase